MLNVITQQRMSLKKPTAMTRKVIFLPVVKKRRKLYSGFLWSNSRIHIYIGQRLYETSSVCVCRHTVRDIIGIHSRNGGDNAAVSFAPTISTYSVGGIW